MMVLVHCSMWGLLASIVFTTLLAASQGIGLTRMNIPYLLGTMFTADRDRAKIYGLGAHLVFGVLFSLLYLLAFSAWGGSAWWKGLILGAIQGAFFLTFGVTLLPGLHPRMASEHEGPTVMRQLEPPGFLGLNYGMRTPASIFAAHLVWGLMLGTTLLRAA
ncbi:MAG: hypothetical protein M3N91_17495 [Pseudomonadota bacterium]|nr:hypothetical protein [Pseudomonadota bacterium]